MRQRGAYVSLVAAALFGLSAPLSKMLLSGIGPLTLASLLYLGGALGLTLGAPLRRAVPGAALRGEAPLRLSDAPLLAGAILTGGILGPALLMLGLQRVSAVTGSLLLNLETPFTILLAVAIFREHLGWRQAAAAAMILAGAAIVGRQSGEVRVEWLGAASITAAGLSWAIDTNISQKLSLRDPVEYTRTKFYGGGVPLLIFASLHGERVPGWRALAAALVIGWVSYGISAVFFVRGLRLVGASRVSAYFATAPFVGALMAIPILGERLHAADVTAMGAMAVGVALLLGESHDHLHSHEAIEHDHAHVHDEHHRHEHARGETSRGAHAHSHRHEPLVHAHPHAPDLHHRHEHGSGAGDLE